MSGGQVLGGIYDITTVMPFLLSSVLVSIAVVPILLTAARAPDFTSPDPVSIRRLYQISPLALIGMLLQGLTASMAFGIGAIYATNIGMTESQASLFMAAFTLGNMLLQYPVGRRYWCKSGRAETGWKYGKAGTCRAVCSASITAY